MIDADNMEITDLRAIVAYGRVAGALVYVPYCVRLLPDCAFAMSAYISGAIETVSDALPGCMVGY